MRLQMIFLAIALLLVPFCLTAQKQDRPNILWLTIEDTSPQFIGCYGNTRANTPVIDSLAGEGVRFTNAFSTGTVCSPSRSTLITGVRTYEMGTGHHRSSYPIPDHIKGFPAYLRETDYYTSNNAKTDYNTSAAERITQEAWDESSKKTGWWGRKPDQPFFAVFNFMECHQSRVMTWPYSRYEQEVLDHLEPAERISPAAVDMPPFYRDTPEMRKQLARVYNGLKLTDKRIGEILDRLKQDGLSDSTIIFLYADHGEGIPRGKTNGIGLGYRVPFVIWFPPAYRHLSPWGTGVVTEELVDFGDLAPTLLSLAGVDKPDYMRGRALLGRQREQPPGFVFGTSDRSDESTDLVRSVMNGRYIYSRNYMPFLSQVRWIRYMDAGEIKQEMRRDFESGRLNPDQEALFRARPAEYLFDLQNDPWELHNLAGDPDRQALLEEMRAALEKNILDSRDVMFLPEYELARLPETGTAYEFRQSEERYPLRRIYAAAGLSGKRGKEVLERQLAFLKDPDPVVRYWAVMGLKSQKAEQLKPHREQVRKAMQDTYPPVRILGAALCVRLWGDEQAKGLLNDACRNENPQLVLLALQGMADLPDLRPFAGSIQFIHEGKGARDEYNLKAATDVLLHRLGIKQLSL